VSDEDQPQDEAAADDEGAAPRDDEVTDELPEDLDAAGYVGPYTFPDNDRRKIPGLIYLAFGGLTVLLATLVGDDSVYVDGGLVVGGVLLCLLGLYSIWAGQKLGLTETDALAAASAEVGFAVGHASAQLGWRGVRSVPTWRILLYSADEPPTMRGLVLVDGIDGEIVDSILEANPEDWAEVTGT
jgi:hypothetical protein